MSGTDVLSKQFGLSTSRGDTIYGDVRYTPGKHHTAVLVVSHSFMAFKDWGFFPHVCREFARRGFCTVSFNFSLNGVAGHGRKITEFEEFSRNTFSREVEDLSVVLQTIREGAVLPAAVENAPLVLFGHSRGGAISVLRVAMEKDIAAIVTWSAVATFDRWTEHQKALWRSHGSLPLARSATVSPLRLGLGLLTDLETHREALDILRAARLIRIPWLIVHGSEDLVVPIREAEALRQAAPAAEMVPVEGAGHLLNATTKREDGYKTLDSVIELTDHWLKRVLQ